MRHWPAHRASVQDNPPESPSKGDNRPAHPLPRPRSEPKRPTCGAMNAFSQLEQTETFMITRCDKQVARLVPAQPRNFPFRLSITRSCQGLPGSSGTVQTLAGDPSQQG